MSRCDKHVRLNDKTAPSTSRAICSPWFQVCAPRCDVLGESGRTRPSVVSWKSSPSDCNSAIFVTSLSHRVSPFPSLQSEFPQTLGYVTTQFSQTIELPEWLDGGAVRTPLYLYKGTTRPKKSIAYIQHLSK